MKYKYRFKQDLNLILIKVFICLTIFEFTVFEQYLNLQYNLNLNKIKYNSEHN